MKADDLVLFSQVVELGSFSKAAEQNSLTNSVVSKRIARLEEELGVQLLYRTTRKLTLTEAGRALSLGARNVKQATQEAMDAISGFGEKIEGTSRCRCRPYRATCFLRMQRLNSVICIPALP